jgi:hypothetical protein
MEMQFCNENGIPHSEFLTWNPEDRAKAMAFVMETALRCNLCGTAPWEWEDNKFAYQATEEFCKGCYQKAVFTDTQSKSLPGTNVKLVPTTPMMKARMAVQAKKRARLRKE